MNPMKISSGGENPDITIETAVDQFINLNRPNWNGETERTYRKSCNTLIDFSDDFDLNKVSDLTLETVGKYDAWLLTHEEIESDSTVLSKQKQAVTFIKWCESKGLVKIGTHLAINKLKLSDKDQLSGDIMPPDQLRELLMLYRNSDRWYGCRRHALLEVIAHTGARRGGIRALDLSDWESETRKLSILSRESRGTRLKHGDQHARKVILSEKPAKVLDHYIKSERYQKRDEEGRKPLFASRQGRPTKSTITNWMYQATVPCMWQECPHAKERHNCEWTTQTKASQCPSSTSPHPIRRGSITWQLNIGKSIEDVASRAGTTPDVIRRYYDRPSLDEELRRRIEDFTDIDICEHQDPSDVDDDIDSEDHE